jgi:very-short-patch-repair endonuclease
MLVEPGEGKWTVRGFKAMPEQPSDRHRDLAYERAKDLRRDVTPAEKVLWKSLRGRRLGGFKFRRQQPVDSFIVDFFCAQAKLILEIDGDSHVGQGKKDGERQAYLESLGYRVLRFWNVQVFDDLETVIDVIWRACSAEQ